MDEPDDGSGGAGSDFEHPPPQPSESDGRPSATLRNATGSVRVQRGSIRPKYGRLAAIPSNAIKRAGIEMS